jgi:diguanylate cyclase (GGDEF)-like protein
MDKHRVRLGRALSAQAEDVVAAVARRLWPAGTQAVDPDVRLAIAETDHLGVAQISRWLTHGTMISEEERRDLGALGGMIDRISLDDLLKAYLSWRDALLETLYAQAAALDSPAALVAEIRALIVRNAEGSAVRMARCFEQERQRLHQLLAEQALHDALTGLPNRTVLFDRLEHALRLAARSGKDLALLFVDLDGFKAVNDHHGHHTGDNLLVAVAQRIREAVREVDTTARLGGDEFVILCENLEGSEEATDIAERIIGALSEPFATDSVDVRISASVGIARVSDAESHGGASELLKLADAAMYAAKQQGRGRHEIRLAVSA